MRYLTSFLFLINVFFIFAAVSANRFPSCNAIVNIKRVFNILDTVYFSDATPEGGIVYWTYDQDFKRYTKAIWLNSLTCKLGWLIFDRLLHTYSCFVLVNANFSGVIWDKEDQIKVVHKPRKAMLVTYVKDRKLFYHSQETEGDVEVSPNIFSDHLRFYQVDTRNYYFNENKYIFYTANSEKGKQTFDQQMINGIFLHQNSTYVYFSYDKIWNIAEMTSKESNVRFRLQNDNSLNEVFFQ